MSVTVRFAPSPTGPLHMGGVRTALYNYLFAKKHGGKFTLRIEDTDQKRFVPGAEQYIMDALRWCGIHWDEGPDTGGPHAPYRQSERREVYHKYALQLIESQHAYYAFDTPEELDQMRHRLEQDGNGNPQYDNKSRMLMSNSLTLSPEEVRQKLDAGQPYVIRFKTPVDEEVVVQDLIRGKVVVSSNLLDDKVIFKSDGLPTYHLANVVDDYLMEISHVIRGEEWLPSAPLHVLLYRCLGWEGQMPAFAHLPLLLKPDGKGKLSKRDGDRLGFPVFPLEWKDPVSGESSAGYRESGYFPEAFVNLLALLGWNPGTEQEVFSMDELISAFSLERVGKSGARFDPEKAKWFNHQHLQKLSEDQVAALFGEELAAKGISCDTNVLVKIAGLFRERVNFIDELYQQSLFLFKAPVSYDMKFASKKWKPGTPAILMNLVSVLEDTQPFNVPALDAALHRFMEDRRIAAGQIMPVLRLALVGAGMGPDLKEIMALLGKEEVVRRIKHAVNTIAVA
ncbi:MAG: glutamate--tRNA ligase [Bacteroidales bacterium]|nr:glutamate--tRNA ligase [Bacteroidales bacterium]